MIGLAGYSGVGGFLALLTLPINWISRRAAEAAVKVRPMLGEVGWFDAFLAGHYGDWMYYHNPVLMSRIVTFTAFMLPFIHLVWFKLKTRGERP